MNNFLTRTISGTVFVAVIVGSILSGAYVCAAMIIAVIILSMLEFYNIAGGDCSRVEKFAGISGGIMLFIAGFLYFQGAVQADIFLIFIPFTVILFISRLYTSNPAPFRFIVCTVCAAAYICAPLTLLAGMMFPYADANPDGNYTPQILLGFFTMLWANDTFAYITGVSFGRRRLFERISPKKSWEGFCGGLICTAALAFPASRLLPVMTFFQWLAVACIIVVFGVYGDLMESLLKRNANIKDSGTFLPGHGGALDRFDSVFIAAPAVFFYLKIICII